MQFALSAKSFQDQHVERSLNEIQRLYAPLCDSEQQSVPGGVNKTAELHSGRLVG
jgi:cob(I)alamin adenosyltransferase